MPLTRISGTLITGNTLGTSSIANSAITSEKIANGAVITVDIADGAVTSIKMANTGVTAGVYGNATLLPRITVGADGRILSVSNTIITGGGGGVGSAIYLQTNFGGF